MTGRRVCLSCAAIASAAVALTCTTTTTIPGASSVVSLVVGNADTSDSQTFARLVYFPSGGSTCRKDITTEPSQWARTLTATDHGVPLSLFGAGSRVAVEQRRNSDSVVVRQGLSGPVHAVGGGLSVFVNLSPARAVGAMRDLNFGRYAAQAIYVSATGGILVVGGLKAGASDFAINAAADFEPNIEYLDPATGKWIVVGDAGEGRRVHHTVSELADGRIVALGGVFGATAVASDLVFDPTTRRLDVIDASVVPAVFGHSATVLYDSARALTNRVLVFGGATTLVADAGDALLPLAGLQKKWTLVDFSGSTPQVTSSEPAGAIELAFHRAAITRETSESAVYWVGGVTGTPLRATSRIFELRHLANPFQFASSTSSLSTARVFHVAFQTSLSEATNIVTGRGACGARRCVASGRDRNRGVVGLAVGRDGASGCRRAQRGGWFEQS
ncbi:MAG: hypothetical protein HYY84_18540 [Deltaproteobacteria bacterium]|nr:hypothetical protein [Deltaproteobacteria bacterium]